MVVIRGLGIYAGIAASAFLLASVWSGSALSVLSPQMFPIYFYQQIAGKIDGRSCPSYPVCSSYARQAFFEYGWLFGSWLTMDRLIHEADDLRKGPRIVFDGEARLHDPLHRNSFWLNTAGQEE